jgi:flagellar assembly protein FliH
MLLSQEDAAGAKPWHPRPFIDRARSSASSPRQNALASRDQKPNPDQQSANLRNAAKRDGYAAGLAEGKAEASQQRERLALICQSMANAMGQLESSIANQTVQLAIDLAQAIVRSEIATPRDVIVAVATEALRALPEAVTTGEILLHPSDLEILNKYLSESDSLGKWRLVADASITIGGCRVVTRSGDVDATIETRWQQALQSIGHAASSPTMQGNG